MALLGSSVIVAILIVVGFVYYRGASGTHLLKNILVSPKTIEQISSQRKSSFIFDKIEFVRADASGKSWGRYAVNLQSYGKFFRMVENERSIPRLTDEMIRQFERSPFSTLTIYLRPSRQNAAVFLQQVQFVDTGALFRVQRNIDDKEEWVYFSHPRIYQKVLELFSPTQQK